MIQIKKYYCLFFLLTFIKGYNQSKQITIVNEVTKMPIENVNVYYPSIDEGTFTNSDGKAAFLIKNVDLKIAHLNYKEITMSSEQFRGRDTIFLKPNVVELKEVVINSFNLVKALQDVLDKYTEIYVDYPFEKECSFKETVLVSNKLKRLVLTKINWWGRSYFYKNNDIKLRLGAIEYSKNAPMDIFTDSSEENTPSKSGFVETKSITNIIYLNSFLSSFLAFTDGYTTSIQESATNQIIVAYETEWKIVKDVSSRCVGKVIFDKESKAIVEFINEIEFKNKIVYKTTSKGKKEYSYKTKKSVTKHNFYKNNDNKWSLKSFSSIVDTSIDYNKKSTSVIFENDIYVLKEIKIKKVSNDGLIDLTKPLYQNLPSGTISSSNSILLSEEEKDFIMKD